MLRWLNRFQVKASVEMLGEIKPLSYLYWNKESVTRTQCSTIWTFLRRQSEDPKDHNTHWVLHRICYDSGTAKLMVNFQVIRGLRTTRDRIVRLFYWKDVLYCRSYSFEYPQTRSDKKQSELNIINLRTSFCQKADSTMDPPSKGLLVDQIRKGGSIVGDGTIEVEVWEHRISVWSFNGKLTLLARTKAIELRMA